MKKIIILFFILIPITGYGQVVQTDSLKQFQSAVLLKDASTSLTEGMAFMLSGAALMTATAIIANTVDMKKGARNSLTISGCSVGVITVVFGATLTFRGYKEIGKAGKRLEYELGAMNSKIALKF